MGNNFFVAVFKSVAAVVNVLVHAAVVDGILFVEVAIVVLDGIAVASVAQHR